MSVTMNNITPHHQYTKPNLSIMLPDPSKYTIQNPPHSHPLSSNANNFNSHKNNNNNFTETNLQNRPHEPLILPPIKELFNSATSSTTPSASSQPPQIQTQSAPAPMMHRQPPPPPPQLYQPQPTTYQSTYSNPISPIANTPEQHLRTQPSNLIPRSNSFQSSYSHQPPQLQQHQPPNSMPFYAPPMNTGGHLSPAPSQASVGPTRSSSNSPVESEAGKEKLNTRKKRQNLPRQTTLILLSWLSEHLERPYPNSREKYDLLLKTGLTIQQLDNWFINARRRKINILRKLKENDQNISLTF